MAVSPHSIDDRRRGGALQPVGRVAYGLGVAVAAVAVTVMLAYILWVFGIILVHAVSSLPLGHSL